jgi:hypothetical protein
MFFNKRLFLDSLINLYLVYPLFKQSYKIFYIFDKGILETFGFSNFMKQLLKLSLFINYDLSRNKYYFYIYHSILSLLILIIYFYKL